MSIIKPLSSSEHVLKFPHPVLKASKLKKKPVRIKLLDKSYVLFRDKEGQPAAVPEGCPHRGAQLSKGKVNADGELVCAYHGWRIRSDGTAVCPSVANRRHPVRKLKTWERHGFIWIAAPETPDSDFPEFMQEGYELVGSFTTPFKAPLKVVLDNFSEIEHAFQVHSFIGPEKSRLDTVDFKAKIHEDRTYGRLSCEFRKVPFFFYWFLGFRKGDRYHNDWVVKFKPVHGSYSNYWTDPKTQQKRPVSFIVTSFMVPVNDREVSMQVFLQMSIKHKVLKLFAPILKWATMLVTVFEIKADADIALFAPENWEESGRWRLTYLDKQIMPNRKLLDSIYLGKPTEKKPKRAQVTSD
jgi:phenylpropionate dioxygenase-like ring-hydroxylating dioxygenase large terminal subunit